MVDELVQFVPPRTQQEKLVNAVGSWQQLWADGLGSGTPGTCADVSNIYQVIFPGGFYWNVARIRAFGAVTTGFLRGSYEVQSDVLRIQFAKQVSTEGFLERGEDPVTAAMKAELGAYDDTLRPGFPVGLAGILGDVYVDDELRIAVGGSAVYGTTFLYILKRIECVK